MKVTLRRGSTSNRTLNVTRRVVTWYGVTYLLATGCSKKNSWNLFSYRTDCEQYRSIAIIIGADILFFWRSHYLSTDTTHVKFFGYNLKFSHYRHISNCWFKKMSYIMWKYIHGLFPYYILHAWIQYLISYGHKFESEREISYGCHVVILHSKKPARFSKVFTAHNLRGLN
jgi:hypothetical protein